MSFLLAQDTCISLLRQHRRTSARARAEVGRLSISALSVFDIQIWLIDAKTPSAMLREYQRFLSQVVVRPVDGAIASRAIGLGTHLTSGTRVRWRGPLLVAATALELGLTLVTHQQAFFAVFPGLVLADWSVP